jgi:hypothetical protein
MSRARARSSSCEALAVEFGRRVRDLRLRLDAPVSQERPAEIAGVQRTYKGYLELNRLEEAGLVRLSKWVQTPSTYQVA